MYPCLLVSTGQPPCVPMPTGQYWSATMCTHAYWSVVVSHLVYPCLLVSLPLVSIDDMTKTMNVFTFFGMLYGISAQSAIKFLNTKTLAMNIKIYLLRLSDVLHLKMLMQLTRLLLKRPIIPQCTMYNKVNGNE